MLSWSNSPSECCRNACAACRARQLNSRTLSTRLTLSSLSRKNIFLFPFIRNHGLIPASRLEEGALRGRHGRRVRDAVGVSGRSMISMRTNDSDTTVKSRGSGTPELMPSLAIMLAHHRKRRGQDSRSPGRARINRNTIAQGRSGCPRPNLWYLPPAFFCCRRAMGEASSRPSLRPRFFRGVARPRTTRAQHAARTRTHVTL
jgi:hypothetical protein